MTLPEPLESLSDDQDEIRSLIQLVRYTSVAERSRAHEVFSALRVLRRTPTDRQRVTS